MHNLVTNEEYKRFKPDHVFAPGEERKPVTNVDFFEATAYAEWLSMETGRKLRLPTEDELIEAEKTFKADFSAWPLAECPSVGTVGSNDEGVTDLLGVVYAWTANELDVKTAREGWKTVVKDAPAPTTGSAQAPDKPQSNDVGGVGDKYSVTDKLNAKIRSLEKEISDVKAALEVVQRMC